jgi:hypothetical protein
MNGESDLFIKPLVGKMLYNPQKLAGTLREPPLSPPMAKSAIPEATATASPPVDPPQVYSLLIW